MSSARVTRSSTRKTTVGASTPTITATKSVAAEKRRQHKNVHTMDKNDDKNGKIDESNGDNVHVTPPKQRKSCPKANALSPSTLLNRLSIGAPEQKEKEIEAAKPKSKIDNARKVLNAAETEELYGREKEINELNEFFTSNLVKKTSASIYISGQPGKYNSNCACACVNW